MSDQRPTTYRKKPVVIEAMGPITRDNGDDIARWCGGRYSHGDRGSIAIDTLEGEMTAQIGDYVIRGIEGEGHRNAGLAETRHRFERGTLLVVGEGTEDHPQPALTQKLDQLAGARCPADRSAQVALAREACRAGDLVAMPGRESSAARTTASISARTSGGTMSD